jgi:hypothetical protein
MAFRDTSSLEIVFQLEFWKFFFGSVNVFCASYAAHPPASFGCLAGRSACFCASGFFIRSDHFNG